MSVPLYAARAPAFDGSASQQGYHGHPPIAYDGRSEYQQPHPPPGNLMQVHMQPSFPASSNPYTSGPYPSSSPVPAQAAPFAGPQQTTPAAHVRSPPQRPSPNAGYRSQTSSHTPPTKYPMAAPPLPLTPQSQQSAAGHEPTPAATTPKSPQSPGGQTREAARVALLLGINRDLLEEVQRLQDQGKGGAISPQQVQQYRSEGKSDHMASDEYIQCLRRVQANFTYLMPKAQNTAGQSTGNEVKQFPGPAHMTPPPHMPDDMKQKYEQLQELFPEWHGLDRRMAGQQQSASPRPGANGATMSSSTTPTA